MDRIVNNWPRLSVDFVVWGFLLILPLMIGGWQVSEFAQFLTYGIFAMSLALIWGHCGLLCFGQAVFFGIGAYAMSLVTLGMVPGLEAWTSSYLGLVCAMALPALVANILGRFLFYGRGLRGAYFGIVMLAVAAIAERLATNWNYIGGLNGLINVPPFNLGTLFGGMELWEPHPVYYFTLAIAFATYIVLEVISRSSYGTVLRAIGINEERTAALGYDTAAYKLTAFTISGGLAGLAGALFVTQFAFASPPLIGFALSTEVLIWVALGGRGLLIAAFLGAIIVRYAEGQFADLFGPYWLLALGGLFLLCVIIVPRGLVGEPVHRYLAWAAGRQRGKAVDGDR